MTSYEIVVIVGGLLLGYYIVTILTINRSDSSANETVPDKEVIDEADYSSSNWAQILEITESATHQQIITAYKQKISQYHPDKVAQMSQEIRDLAENRSQQINAAYNYAMKRQKK